MSYSRPTDLTTALELLAQGRATVLAGGTDIYPATPARDLTGEILDITSISGLSGIAETSDGWRIGALTRWSEIAHATLPPAFDALKQAAIEVGSVQIQNSGTIGGNLCNASPAADGVPALMILDASVELAAAGQSRRLALADFILGPRQTALGPDEIVTAVHVPKKSAKGQAQFRKLGTRRYLVISIAMVAVRLELAGGQITKAAIAVGACSPVARRLAGAERALIGASPLIETDWLKALQASIASDLSPIDDLRADAAYRSHAVAEMVNAAIGDLLKIGAAP